MAKFFINSKLKKLTTMAPTTRVLTHVYVEVGSRGGAGCLIAVQSHAHDEVNVDDHKGGHQYCEACPIEY